MGGKARALSLFILERKEQRATTRRTEQSTQSLSLLIISIFDRNQLASLPPLALPNNSSRHKILPSLDSWPYALFDQFLGHWPWCFVALSFVALSSFFIWLLPTLQTRDELRREAAILLCNSRAKLENGMKCRQANQTAPDRPWAVCRSVFRRGRIDLRAVCLSWWRGIAKVSYFDWMNWIYYFLLVLMFAKPTVHYLQITNTKHWAETGQFICK